MSEVLEELKRKLEDKYTKGKREGMGGNIVLFKNFSLIDIAMV